MFQSPVRPTRTRSVLSVIELIYHSVVRDVRKSHRNAFMGLFLNMMQTIVFVLTFYAMFELLGMRGNAIRGDFLLYIMSGIFLFITHTKTVSAVVASEGPASPMMQHAPMNSFIALCASAISALYLQVLSLIVVLFFYHVLFTPVVIDQPIGAMSMIVAAWFCGVGVGTCFLALKPWAPDFVKVAVSIYSRANMIASGKMFVANTLPSPMLALFTWNPLFHTIDQERGYVFLHYNPHFSSSAYPYYVGIALIMIGLIGENYTRKHASVSWNAAR